MNTRRLLRRVFVERRRVLLPLLVILAANAAVLALVAIPLRTAVSAAATDAANAARELDAARRLEEQVNQARTSKAHADEQLQRFYGDVLPDSLPAAQKIMNLFVTEAARDAGLDFQGSRFDWGEVRDSLLTRASSRITLRGSYANIRRFLHAVEVAEEFIVVERVELVQQTDEVAAAGPLEVSLVVATYFATRPTS